MSAEIDFRAALVAETALTALVGTRIVQNGIPEGQPLPYVVFTSSHDLSLGLDGSVLADQVAFNVECWATGALVADQVADAVVLALQNHAPLSSGAVAITRTTGFDQDNGLDATVLSIEWWQ